MQHAGIAQSMQTAGTDPKQGSVSGVGDIYVHVMLLLLQVGNEIILAKDDINVFLK